MAEPKIRFKKANGMAYPSLQKATMGDFYAERNERGNKSLPVLTVSIHSGVSDGELDEDELGKRMKRSTDLTQYKKAVEGDLVFNMMRAWQGAVGSVKTTGVVSPAYIVAKPKLDIDPSFMDYYVQSKHVIDRFNRLSYGALDFRKRLYWDSFVTTEVNIPDIEEQQKIADFLSSVDEVITASEKEVTILETQKKAAMKKIFSQEVRFKKADGRDFPKWDDKKIGDLTEEYKERNKKRLPLEIYSVNNVVGFLPQTEQFNGAGYLSDTDTSIYMIVPPGHFAYNPARINVGSIGYQNIGHDVQVSSLYEVFKTKDGLDDCFLWHWFHTKAFSTSVRRLQEGGVRQYFYFEKMKETRIKLPCPEEQRLIADFLSDFDEAIAAAKKELELWKELKKGLLQQMFV